MQNIRKPFVGRGVAFWIILRPYGLTLTKEKYEVAKTFWGMIVRKLSPKFGIDKLRRPVNAMWRFFYIVRTIYNLSGRIIILSGRYTSLSGRISISSGITIYELEKYPSLFTWPLPKIVGLLRRSWLPVIIHTIVTFFKVCFKFKKETNTVKLAYKICDISTVLRTPNWRAKGMKLWVRYWYVLNVWGYFWRLMSQYNLGFNRWNCECFRILIANNFQNSSPPRIMSRFQLNLYYGTFTVIFRVLL